MSGSGGSGSGPGGGGGTGPGRLEYLIWRWFGVVLPTRRMR